MNGLQFAALLIACAVVYRYAIHDKLKVGNMETWPENKNPILSVFRENFDSGDKWGSTLLFLFALCDVAVDYGVEVPAELEFSQALGGSDTDDYSYRAITELLVPDAYVYAPLTVEELQKHTGHALKVLAKYDALLRLAGEDY